jgi:hypothetical protein
LRQQVRKDVLLGLESGLVLAGYAVATDPYFATFNRDAASRSQALTPPFAVRILYDGAPRRSWPAWGVMTLVCWTAWRPVGRPSGPPSAMFWIGIVAVALAFGRAHLPFLLGLAGDPSYGCRCWLWWSTSWLAWCPGGCSGVQALNPGS